MIAAEGIKRLDASANWEPDQVFEWKRYMGGDDMPKMFPFQIEGVCGIEHSGGRVLLADEMGLGKTCQSLAWLAHKPDAWPVLIVCPASLRLNWLYEARKWLGDFPEIEILSGTPKKLDIQQPKRLARIRIINYDILSKWQKYLVGFRTVVLDECHYIKSSKAARSKAAVAVAERCRYFIGITGTPILNRPIEMFNALNLIDPRTFGSWWDYAKHYCGMKKTRFGLDVNGATNLDRLRASLQGKVIRRLKANVLTELPDKIFGYAPLVIGNETRAKYEELKGELTKWKGRDGDKKDKMAGFALIEHMKQALIPEKLEMAMDWIGDFLESGESLVVFGVHKVIARELLKRFGDVAVSITGDTPMKKRDEAVQAFQAGRKKLFIGNIQAAGVGLTLTKASNVLFLELPWTPGELDQAIDRCHRIGQKNTVNVTFLMCLDTIDEILFRMINKKRKIGREALDGYATEQDDMFEMLVEELTN